MYRKTMGDLTEASTHVDRISLICCSSLLLTASGLVTCRKAGGVEEDPDLVIGPDSHTEAKGGFGLAHEAPFSQWQFSQVVSNGCQ